MITSVDGLGISGCRYTVCYHTGELGGCAVRQILEPVARVGDSTDNIYAGAVNV